MAWKFYPTEKFTLPYYLVLLSFAKDTKFDQMKLAPVPFSL
jgi:hypothetical protein